MEGNKLLMDESPLQVLPTLAVKLGLNEAVILQQIHYWLVINQKAKKNQIQGRTWTYGSYEKWKNDNFPFFSIPTIRRTITHLEDKGIILRGNFNSSSYDRTSWYSIDYDRLENVLTDACDQIDQMGETQPIESDCAHPCDQIDHMEGINLITSLKETKEETLKENNAPTTGAIIPETLETVALRESDQPLPQTTVIPGAWGMLAESGTPVKNPGALRALQKNAAREAEGKADLSMFTEPQRELLSVYCEKLQITRVIKSDVNAWRKAAAYWLEHGFTSDIIDQAIESIWALGEKGKVGSPFGLNYWASAIQNEKARPRLESTYVNMTGCGQGLE